MQPLPAPVIEREVGEAIRRWVPMVDEPFSILRSVNLSERRLHLALHTGSGSGIASRLADGEVLADRDRQSITVLRPVNFPTKGGRRLIIPASTRSASPDPVLIAALRRAPTASSQHGHLQKDRAAATLVPSARGAGVQGKRAPCSGRADPC